MDKYYILLLASTSLLSLLIETFFKDRVKIVTPYEYRCDWKFTHPAGDDAFSIHENANVLLYY